VTQSYETLLAIAGAFDAPVDSLRSTWLIPESRLVGVQTVNTWKEFVAAEESSRTQEFAKVIMVPLKDDRQEEVRETFEQVFTDRELIEPDVHSIKEPLQQLFDWKFSLFLLDQQRDLLLRTDGGFKPEKPYIEDWRGRYFVLVPRYGCFRLSVTEPLHRFTDDCPIANEILFQIVKRKATGLFVYTNAVFAISQSGDEGAVSWCERCFPLLPSGTRISFEYIEQVTGLTRDQLSAVYTMASEPPPLEGLS
jgi:hypothetical protein